MTVDRFPREKSWKLIYIRSNKLHRAKQLGFEYPRMSESAFASRESIKLLFVCSMNRWRSPTAEKIYSDKALVEARSAGTNRSARIKVTSQLLKWADIVFVMEDKHKSRLLSMFAGELKYKELVVLGIPDDYQFMDEELIEEITRGVDPVLKKALRR